MVVGEGSRSAHGKRAGILLGVLDELLQRLELAFGCDDQGQWRPLEDRHRNDLFGLVPHLLLQRLQDDVGDVESGDEIPVRICSRQLPPAQGAAAACFVVDQDLLLQDALQVRLLASGLPVGLAARSEHDEIGDLLCGVIGGGQGGNSRHG